MSKIIIMRGLPASGKSTRAQEISKEMGNAVRMNKDLLRTMLHFDKFTGVNESRTIAAAKDLTRTFLKADVSVIIDDTNLNPSTVESWKTIAKECDAKIQYVDIDTSVEECIRRDSVREKKVGKHVIEKMAMQYKDYMREEKVIICDLDGTLCDITHRLHFVKVPEGEKKDWNSFFAGIPEDSLRLDVLQRINEDLRNNNARLVFVSARPNKYRTVTEEWLKKTIGSYNYILIMREDNDSRPDTEVKSEIYSKYLKNMDIRTIYDDRPSVIRMWRDKGLNVEDVGKGIEF